MAANINWHSLDVEQNYVTVALCIGLLTTIGLLCPVTSRLIGL